MLSTLLGPLNFAQACLFLTALATIAGTLGYLLGQMSRGLEHEAQLGAAREEAQRWAAALARSRAAHARIGDLCTQARALVARSPSSEGPSLHLVVERIREIAAAGRVPGDP